MGFNSTMANNMNDWMSVIDSFASENGGRIIPQPGHWYSGLQLPKSAEDPIRALNNLFTQNGIDMVKVIFVGYINDPSANSHSKTVFFKIVPTENMEQETDSDEYPDENEDEDEEETSDEEEDVHPNESFMQDEAEKDEEPVKIVSISQAVKSVFNGYGIGHIFTKDDLCNEVESILGANLNSKSIITVLNKQFGGKYIYEDGSYYKKAN